jgi:hypothetical protein
LAGVLLRAGPLTSRRSLRYEDRLLTITSSAASLARDGRRRLQAAERTSPMFDNVLNATPVTGRVAAPA